MARPHLTTGTRLDAPSALTSGMTFAVALLMVAGVLLAALAIPLAESVATAPTRCDARMGPYAICNAGAPQSAIGTRAQTPTWINASSPGRAPPLDYWASMAYDPVDHEFVLFGGCQDTQCPTPAQTWTFAHGAWSNVTDASAPPPSRSYATLDFDSADGYVLLFGGIGSSVLGDTWAFSGGRWANLTGSAGTPPPARWGASLAYDPVEHGILLFGGRSAQGSLLDDTWLFSSGSWHALAPSASPPARYESSMAWDAADSEVVLVSGCGTSCPVNDTWRFSGHTWSPLPQGSGPTPGGRSLAAMTYDGAGNALRLFGGIRNGTSLGDTWQYAGGTWTLLNLPSSPRAREGSAAPESTEAWLSNGTPAISPFTVLWGGDWLDCTTCTLRGLEDTWVFEVPPQASVALLGSPAAPGEALAFEALASGGTPPFSYRWTFGDGGSGTGANTTHAFDAPGLYQVSLVATDDAGARTTTVYQVTVAAPSPWLGLAEWLGIGFAVGLAAAVLAWRIRARPRPPLT